MISHRTFRRAAPAAAALVCSLPVSAQFVWSPLGLQTVPSPRTVFGMAHDPTRSITFLFGGNDASFRPNLSDTWFYTGARWFELPIPGPTARSGFEMVWDDARQQIVLYGGQGQTGLLADTWTLDRSGWRELQVPGGPALSAHAMAYDSGRARVVRFGGLQRVSGRLTGNGETWEWDGSSWTLAATTGPSPRFAAAMAYDASRGRCVLFGGNDLRQALDDTWEWDGATWQLIPAASPPIARGGHDMVWDAVRQRVILHGGASPNGQEYSDTWQWDGARWEQLSASGPARQQGGMIYDPARQEIFQHGGAGPSGIETDSWRLLPTTRGSVASIGPGCAPAGGERSLEVVGPPIVGAQEFALRIPGLADGTAAFCALSLQQGVNQMVSGCAVYPQLPFSYAPSTVAAGGVAEFALPIPAAASLAGAVLIVQGGTLEAGPLFGAARLTDGLRIDIGD